MPPSFDFKQTLAPTRLLGVWRMLTGYHHLYVGALVCIGLAAVAQTSFYFLLRYFTDTVLGNAALQYQLPWVALGFVGLALVQGSLTFIGGRSAARASEGVTRRLRDYLYDHIQRLSFAYHDRTPTGELIQRSTSDVDALRRFYGEESVGFGRVVMLFVVNFIALLTLNVTLGLISVIVVPLIAVVSVLFFKRISQRYELFQEQEGKLSTTLQENLTGIRVVRAFARQAYEQDKFERDNLERFVRGRRLLLLHALYWPTTDVMVGIQLVAGYALGAIIVINGVITVGTFLAYMGMLGWIMWPMRNVGRLIVQMSIGLVSYGRVSDIIKEDREPLDVGDYRPTKPLRGELVFENVSFAYDEELPVLHDISFRCEPGQVVALVGATGSGKTSLVNLLPRFYEYSGSIKLDGVELRDYPRRYLRRQIGLVQQEPFLFSRTIRENITYGVIEAREGAQGSGGAGEQRSRGAEVQGSNGAVGGLFGRNGSSANGTAEAAYLRVPDEEVFRAAEAAAVHKVILTFPEGYNTIVGEKGVTLSGGQKQRVTLARTLLKDPRILILDDATSSVDMETEAAIQYALDELLPGRTTFIIAHRIQTVMRADLILVLEKGRVVQCGTHDELIDQPGTYQRIFRLQSQIEEELEEDLSAVMKQ